MRKEIISAFTDVAALERSQIFDDNRLEPITAVNHAQIPAPGWVGSHWAEGTLLVAINPGGGGDAYKVNPTDDRLYNKFRELRDAKGENAQASAMHQMSEDWIDIQKSHNIWRLISAVLHATGENFNEIAYINIVPFRTREDKLPRKAELARSWTLASKRQVDALQPKRIIALGKKAYKAMLSAGADQQCEIILIKRTIGDSYICAEAREVLDNLRSNNF